ncbi:MAG: PD40 domain-containing protein [Phycisphaerae bacterium]|nr:PD40 domain-containing protein [Phycisphaerae bacterium]
MAITRNLTIALLFTGGGIVPAWGAGPMGYYRQPAVCDQTVVFVAEGDLWKVSVTGGVATRLTSHPGEESWPRISPDGATIGFTAGYEGPLEVYTMPLAGGLPVRRSYDGEKKSVCGFSPDGRLLYATAGRTTLPGMQLMLVNLSGAGDVAADELLPLSQAAEGCFDDTGRTLFFTRFAFQGSSTKRYKGGTAQNLWRFDLNGPEAVPLTKDYAGTSKAPMWWSGRLYFASDRDGTMNLWSMRPDGSDLGQHTRHVGWDVIAPAMSGHRIVYQLGADLRLYDAAIELDKALAITLDSDLDQTREHWVKKPSEYITSAHVSPDGDRVALTARGQVFVAPRSQGRLAQVTRKEGVRYRDARFLPDGKTLLVMSDESGEVEFWKLPANGVGDDEQLTHDGDILRWGGLPSPDGKIIAHHDKNRRLFLYDCRSRQNRRIDESKYEDFADLCWSADSKWLAYVAYADNQFKRVRLYCTKTGEITDVTSDRFDSRDPAFSSDGKWLYLLSDRNLKSSTTSPWGNYQPEPFMDKKTEILLIALRADETRSPFAARDELHPDKAEKNDKTATTLPTGRSATQSAPGDTRNHRAALTTRSFLRRWLPAVQRPTSRPASRPATEARVDLAGIQSRLIKAPVPPGNYESLKVTEKALFWLSKTTGETSSLQAMEIGKETHEVKTVAPNVSRFELSQDGKKILVQTRGGGYHIIDANPAPADLGKNAVDLSRWSLSVIPRQEWRQMFIEAWRLERDYFYDPHMHGVDWKAVREKYRPLVDRVTSREELSDLLAQMVSELSALHIFVKGGDLRKGDDDIAPSSLGAVLARDPRAGGYRVGRVCQTDPDEPDLTGPLRKLEVDVKEGDVIEMVNGRPALGVPDIRVLLRGQAGQQVLLRIKPQTGGKSRDVIVVPISMEAERNLRYHDWEHSRRLIVEELGQGRIGYVHLRAMGDENWTEWSKGFYPVWDRQGLVIDVRNNRGGNIDPWILGRLLRKEWFYWADRFGRNPIGAMQYAFSGHVAVLCNERTSSDGEAFCDGIQRLKIGKVFGTRTWGGAIWLSANNFLVDRGIATAAESGTYGPDGNWLIEGRGLEPDVVVENLPHATFKGEDAQLRAAIEYLQKRIKEQPLTRPAPAKFPDKSLPKPAMTPS